VLVKQQRPDCVLLGRASGKCLQGLTHHAQRERGLQRSASVALATVRGLCTDPGLRTNWPSTHPSGPAPTEAVLGTSPAPTEGDAPEIPFQPWTRPASAYPRLLAQATRGLASALSLWSSKLGRQPAPLCSAGGQHLKAQAKAQEQQAWSLTQRMGRPGLIYGRNLHASSG